MDKYTDTCAVTPCGKKRLGAVRGWNESPDLVRADK